MTKTIVSPSTKTSTIPKTSTTTAKIPFEPCLTVRVGGAFFCNCGQFHTNELLFGVAECDHTRRAAEAGRLHDLALAAEPKHYGTDYDDWLNEQERLADVEFAQAGVR